MSDNPTAYPPPPSPNLPPPPPGYPAPPPTFQAPAAPDYAQPRAGIVRNGKTAESRATAAAAHRAASSDHAITGPASAEPTGVPSQLTDIEIANARPNQAGSVRRCRSVNSATSNGPFAKPTANITANTTVIDAAKGKTAIAAALNTIAPNMRPRSRPRLSMRPVSSAETSPDAPTGGEGRGSGTATARRCF